MTKQVRIQSDGMGKSTVVTTDSGEKLYPISAVIWLDAAEVNRVDLSFHNVVTDIHADVDTVDMTCVLCSHSHKHKCVGRL